MIIQEVIDTWAEYDPAEGYCAGLDSCKGKLFIPTPEAIDALRSRIHAVRKTLGQISDLDLRLAAEKTLNCISLDLPSPRPERQVFNCALGVFYILLKGDHKSDFVVTYLDSAERLLRFEIARWEGTIFPIAVCKAGLDAADLLEATLSSLKGVNREAVQKINRVGRQLIDYRELFPLEGVDRNKFEVLFPMLEAERAAASPTAKYDEILSEGYDYGLTADEIREQCVEMLDAELKTVNSLVEHICRTCNLPTGKLEDIHAQVGKLHPLTGDVLEKSRQVLRAVNDFTDELLQDTGREPVTLEIAPSHLVPLITSGATLVYDYLAKKPKAKIYITGERNESLLTLLNVLCHEATHAYQGLVVAKSIAADIVQLRSMLSIPSSEAMAFHREWEFYDAIANLTLKKSAPTPVEQEMLALFGSSPEERARCVAAFELETRIWRVARYLRAIFDVDVNRGEKSYVEFVNWANQRTGLSKKFIHDECFTFLALPGYSPGYAICGGQYARIQDQRITEGATRRDFNTHAQQIGYWPWTLYAQKL